VVGPPRGGITVGDDEDRIQEFGSLMSWVEDGGHNIGFSCLCYCHGSLVPSRQQNTPSVADTLYPHTNWAPKVYSKVLGQ